MPPRMKYARHANVDREEYESAMEEAEELREEIRSELDGAYDDFRRVERRLSTLPERMHGIRKRGYYFIPDMEKRLSSMQKRWETIRPRVINEFDNFTRYRGFGSEISFLIDAGFFGYDRFGLQQLRDAEQRARYLNNRVSTIIAPVGLPLSKLTFKVDHVNSMLTDLKGASFKLGKGEKAGWFERNDIIWGGRKRKCNVFFTSHRVIFEERATGIINKKRRKTIYSYPLSDISGFDVERGFLGIGDKIKINFAGGDSVTVKVGNPDNWISRAQPFTKQSFYKKLYSVKGVSKSTVAAGSSIKTKNAKEVKRLRLLLDKLDEQLALGKISEKTYRELRTKYESRLSRLI